MTAFSEVDQSNGWGSEPIPTADKPPAALESPRFWRWFFILLACGIILRVFTAFHSEGIWAPDEHQQYMEQAFRWLHGYGVTYWEQERGMRHPCFRFVLGGLLYSLEHLGIDNPLLQASLIRMILAMTTYAGMVLLALDLYRRGHSVAALFLMFVFAAMLDLVYINARTLSDNAIIVPLCIALVLWERRPGLAGLFLGLMFGLRLQSLFFSAGFWLVTICQDWKGRHHHPNLLRAAGRTIALSLGLLMGLLLMGYWDYVEYGRWFHSALANVQANLLEGQANHYGTKPFLFYLWLYGSILFLSSVFALPLLFHGIRKAAALACVAGVALLAHSLIGHKEGRFLWGIYPILCVALALGFEYLWSAANNRRAFVSWIVGSFLVGACIRFAFLPWNKMPFPATANLLQHLNNRPDVQGVAILACHPWDSGNYFYLRKYKGIYYPGPSLQGLLDFPKYKESAIDYVIMPRSLLSSETAIPFHQIDEYRGWVLLEKQR
jgi:hypothetical protein